MIGWFRRWGLSARAVLLVSTQDFAVRSTPLGADAFNRAGERGEVQPQAMAQDASHIDVSHHDTFDEYVLPMSLHLSSHSLRLFVSSRYRSLE